MGEGWGGKLDHGHGLGGGNLCDTDILYMYMVALYTLDTTKLKVKKWYLDIFWQ